MHGNPLTRTLFGSKSTEIARGTIWLLYLSRHLRPFCTGDNTVDISGANFGNIEK
jgi:hypothetical protein